MFNKLIIFINFFISLSILIILFLIKEFSSSLKHTKIRPVNRFSLPEKQDESV
jgi:hypothetical protein